MSYLNDLDPGWVQRHVALMRMQRGHWCFVEGCTGSQPLMWVPTEDEVRAESHPCGRAIDLPPHSLWPPSPLLHVGMTRPDGTTPMHIHWAERP